MEYHDTLAADHARAGWLEKLLHRRDARFESARQFGFFAGLVIDEWHAGCPGLRSSMAGSVELAKLGTVVQTSITLPDPPSLSYHVEWIVAVLYAARRSIIRSRASEKRHAEPTAADREFGNQTLQIWAQVDIHDDTQRRVAQRCGVSQSTVSRRVDRCRRHVHDALRRADRLKQ